MKSLIWIGFLSATVATASAQAQGQAKVPADINPQTNNRLAPVQRQDLDEKGKAVYDRLAGANNTRPLGGFFGVGIYNPSFAQVLRDLHTAAVNEGKLDPRSSELAILTATREVQMSPGEWGSHETAAIRAGVDKATVDAIKFGRDLTGVPEKDALVIRFGRELYRDKHIKSETFAKAVEMYGARGVVDMIATMCDYALVATLMQAVDAQWPAERMLPPLNTK